MSTSALPRLSDLRAVHALVNECRELGDAATLWRQHCSSQLAGMCGGELVVSGEVSVVRGRVVALHTADWGWGNGFNRQAFLRALEDCRGEVGISPLIVAYLSRPQSDGEALTRADLLSDAEWYPTPFFQRIQRPIGQNHALLSYRLRPGRGVLSAINLCRGIDSRRDFSGRARRVLEAAHAALTPLMGGPLAGFDEPSPAALPPRVRQVLGCLLEGDSDKQVAARLRLSKHTVNQYVKTIFAHFGVSSRPELLARWVRRGWGARRAWLDG